MLEYATYTQLGNNGKFGNQLFEIAMTIAYALDTGKEFAFPKWEYSKYMQKELPGGFFIQIDHRIPDTDTFSYVPLPKLPGNVDIFNCCGQSAKYFAHQWNEIRPYFALKQQYYEYIWDKYGHILAVNPCSIHVRRTDYTTPANLEYHGIMPVSYYEQGAEILYGTSKPEDITFVIFSDDIQWCKENFNFPQQVFIEGEQNIIDMFFMSMCQNHIIGNSSFSWWGAWLNYEHRNKTVCPKKWFGEACPHSSKDIPADGWIVI